MNKTRRIALDELKIRLEEVIQDLEVLASEEEEYMSSIPENLQGAIRYEVAESAYDNLSEAVCQLNEAVDSITVAVEGD